MRARSTSGASIEAARYNDELVPDGNGGSEPRWTCNCVINTRQDAYTVLNSVASSMLALLYWSNGTVFVAQDRRSGRADAAVHAGRCRGRPVRLSGRRLPLALDRRRGARGTTRATSYNAAVELVQDQTLVGQQGYRETQQAAYRLHLARSGAAASAAGLIYTNQFETEVVTFRVGLENADVRPGEIVAISDPSRVGARLGGRLLDDDGPDTLTLDAMPDQITANPAAWTIYIVVGSAAEAQTPTVIAVPVQPVLGGQPAAGDRQDRRHGGGLQLDGAAAPTSQPTHWRVASVTDQGQGKYEIARDRASRGEVRLRRQRRADPAAGLLAGADRAADAALATSPISEYIYLDARRHAAVRRRHVVAGVARSARHPLHAGDERAGRRLPALRARSPPSARTCRRCGRANGSPCCAASTISAGARCRSRLTFTPVGLTAKPLPPERALHHSRKADCSTLMWVPTGEIDVGVLVGEVVAATPMAPRRGTTATTSIARVSRDTTQIDTPTRAGTFMVKAIDASGRRATTATSAILLPQITERVEVAARSSSPTGGRSRHQLAPPAPASSMLPPPAEPEPVPPGVFPGDRALVAQRRRRPASMSTASPTRSISASSATSRWWRSWSRRYGRFLGRTMSTWMPLASQVPLGAGASGTMATWVPLAIGEAAGDGTARPNGTRTSRCASARTARRSTSGSRSSRR